MTSFISRIAGVKSIHPTFCAGLCRVHTTNNFNAPNAASQIKTSLNIASIEGDHFLLLAERIVRSKLIENKSF